MQTGVTLAQNLRAKGTDEALVRLMEGVATASKVIADGIAQGELGDALGTAETENVQGETQKKLDIVSNEIFISTAQASGAAAGLASEEMEDIYPLVGDGEYLMVFDPLDGSSNIDVNVSVGSIFSILKSPSTDPQTEDYLQAGNQQVGAGYVVYGPSTVMVLTTGEGTHCYTLDRAVGEFILSKENVQIPASTSEFAINASNQRHWEPEMQAYVSDCIAGKEGPRERDFNMRWIASMVADVHRILTRGGVFIYPVDAKLTAKGQGGKLRLMYEANPMAMLVEQAGGAASTGRGRIMDLPPEQLHQRVAVVLGSKDEVAAVEEYYKG